MLRSILVFAPVFRYFDVFDKVDDFGFWHGLPKVDLWRSALAHRAFDDRGGRHGLSGEAAPVSRRAGIGLDASARCVAGLSLCTAQELGRAASFGRSQTETREVTSRIVQR